MAKKTNELPRSAGILLAVSSLPSAYGIGSLGAAAYAWVDFLQAAGQRYWQVLPLGPTGPGNSPYQSPSAFACNPNLIDLDLLCEEGLLDVQACAKYDWGRARTRIDYKKVGANKDALLRLAFERFEGDAALLAFRTQNAWWLDDYALFMAIKTQVDARPFQSWEAPLKLRTPAALLAYRQALKAEIEYHQFVQYVFDKQWRALRAYANAKGIELIGDIPIYVSLDSADVWAHSELFLLDKSKTPIDVAGCPPDYFSQDGQLWNNPLYRWDVLQATGYRWWIARLKQSFSLYDVVRIDHFRGLESYYAIPYGSTTAREGVWRKGPNMDFVRAIQAALGAAPIIAEDLGVLTPGVHRLLKQSGYPGMKVLQFAFTAGEESDYLPHNYKHTHCIVYTGTHDNQTVCGFIKSAAPADARYARAYLQIQDDASAPWAFIRAALGSIAGICIVQMQDYLCLGDEARMNIPSTVGGLNWRWRMKPGAASKRLAANILHLTALYGRQHPHNCQEKGKA